MALGLAAAAAPSPAQPPGSPRIGVLNTALAPNAPMVEGLKQGLRQQGIDAAFEVRFTRGREAALPGAAAELVQARVDLIFANGAAAAAAARSATPSIPIVFTVVSDPIAAGLVKDPGKPEGNVTGVSGRAVELTPKRLDLLKAAAPAVRRVVAITHPDDPATQAVARKAQEAATARKLGVVVRPARTLAELDRALAEVKPGDALLVPALAGLEIPGRILEYARANRVPTVFPTPLFVHQGALLSYGPDAREEGVQAAALVAKILKGAPPASLPVEGAKKLVLGVNLESAKALGLTIPRDLLRQADQVVE